MKKMLLGVIAVLSFASAGQAQETYNFTSVFEVYQCAPNTPQSDCPQIPDPYEIINFAITLKDLGSSNPKYYSGSWSEDRIRDDIKYNLRVTVNKIVYPEQTIYEIENIIYSENVREGRRVVLQLPSMADFKGGFVNYSDSYPRGDTNYYPYFALSPK